MIKKVLIIVSILNLIPLVQSCCMQELDHKWEDFGLSLIDNSGAYPVVTDLPGINKRALGFRINLIDTIFYVYNPEMISQCFATSCGKKYTRIHDLDFIRIRTLNNYSNYYLSGADITQLFKARVSEETKNNFITINEIIEKVNKSSYRRENPTTFDLYLMDTTCTGGEQKFEISLKFSNGDTLKTESKTINLY